MNFLQQLNETVSDKYLKLNAMELFSGFQWEAIKLISKKLKENGFSFNNEYYKDDPIKNKIVSQKSKMNDFGREIDRRGNIIFKQYGSLNSGIKLELKKDNVYIYLIIEIDKTTMKLEIARKGYFNEPSLIITGKSTKQVIDWIIEQLNKSLKESTLNSRKTKFEKAEKLQQYFKLLIKKYKFIKLELSVDRENNNEVRISLETTNKIIDEYYPDFYGWFTFTMEQFKKATHKIVENMIKRGYYLYSFRKMILF